MTAAPTPLTFAVLRVLADGEFHSGQALAVRFACSRASIHNALREAEVLGLDLYRVRGRGYRLPQPPEWLDAAAIRAELAGDAPIFNLELLDCADSSNSLLMRRVGQGAPSGTVLAVEWQTAGRGRLGRRWHSGFGNGLTFSLLWRFDGGLSALSGLSLAVGVALIRAIRRLSVGGAYLKWPNDVLDGQGRKLAGILIEAQGDMLGPSAVVIGIGMNVSLPDRLRGQLDQPASSLAELAGGVPGRNRLLAAVLRELAAVLREFARHGFAGLREEWEAAHLAQHQPVCLLAADGTETCGTARGVDASGALRLETAHGELRVHAGEISLRMAA